MSFVASLVQSAAWPAAVFVIVILMRKPLQEAVTHRLRRLKAGPIETEFDAEAVEVRDDVRRIPEVAAAEPRQGPVSLVDKLAQLVDVSPRGAVMEAFGRIEARLGDLLRAVGLSPPKRTAWQVADLAFNGGDGMTRLTYQVPGEAEPRVTIFLRDRVIEGPQSEVAKLGFPQTPPQSSGE